MKSFVTHVAIVDAAFLDLSENGIVLDRLLVEPFTDVRLGRGDYILGIGFTCHSVVIAETMNSGECTGWAITD